MGKWAWAMIPVGNVVPYCFASLIIMPYRGWLAAAGEPTLALVPATLHGLAARSKPSCVVRIIPFCTK